MRFHTETPCKTQITAEFILSLPLFYRSAQKGFAVGFWPLPESFWPDVSAPALPQRSAHPNIKFTCMNQEPMIIDNLPFDKYELEPSPLTLYILARKQPNVCWQVFIQNSSRSPGMDKYFPIFCNIHYGTFFLYYFESQYILRAVYFHRKIFHFIIKSPVISCSHPDPKVKLRESYQKIEDYFFEICCSQETLTLSITGCLISL